MAERWQPKAAPSVQVDRILDAAGRCIERRGVEAVTLGDVAAEAGCSRPTVYRYFADRDALRAAFVEREARRVGRGVAAQVAAVRDPAERLLAATQAALAGVRGDPTLAAWFAPGGMGTTHALAGSSSAVVDATTALVAGADGSGTAEEAALGARWLVRVILSLLANPAADEDEERALIERFVVPVLLGRVPVTTAPATA